jgi:chromosome partitioning protein
MAGAMIVVGVIGQKGGGGKTTISLNLAVAAAEQGLAAAVVDIDQQANAAKWRDRRNSENVAVIGALQSRIKQTLEAARSHGADFVVIDSPGHNDSAAMETARASDIVLLPVEPQMFHFDTLPAMRDLVRIAGEPPTYLLINKLHPAATVQADRLRHMIESAYNMPLCPVHLSRLDIYAASADLGLTPMEQEPEGKAALEIRGLYKFICQQVNKLRNEDVKNTGLATGT